LIGFEDPAYSLIDLFVHPGVIMPAIISIEILIIPVVALCSMVVITFTFVSAADACFQHSSC
jgi:hypothetical protein